MYQWKFEEASAMLTRLAAVGWKRWKLNLDTANYKPISLLAKEAIEWNELNYWSIYLLQSLIIRNGLMWEWP